MKSLTDSRGSIMTFLWDLSEDFPNKLYGKYNKKRGPDRFVFWKGKDIPKDIPTPEFCFEASKDRFQTWDVVGNDAGLPLVGPRVISILSRIAPNDVQLIAVDFTAKNEPVTGWALLNPLFAIKAIDHQESKYWFILKNDRIGGFRRLRFMDNCLGEHHIARDAEYLPHILVDQAVRTAFEDEKIRGVQFVPPENYLPPLGDDADAFAQDVRAIRKRG
jgi:hypothetical protein